ncbi:fibronectin type III domain-containing protein [Dactylosporangium matsuzakiense]|uniref:Fibronectin type-III domain-containing protein n=1 Tax=Dactylosporangium matsuzakiense TaxID=53360 RepID=A0A9W6NK55_9ACTN|nr:fibronectin type III domain-containing protein [Dactylosporangium matsuzakiense]UWZ42489.1 fibronectin type III domain-containing protein [Dactylosporangium matsuzakiense]GLL00595.1 hypothetical protein GCM10017581_023360 [Dactylosporangium matsuzakiense]
MTRRVQQLGRAGVAVLLAAVAGAAAASPAHAATHAVTTTADGDDLGACANPAVTTGTGADGQLSLREALCRARNAGTGSVTVPAGTYPLTLGALVVTGGAGAVKVTVTGAGAAATIVDGGAADRVFELDPTETGDVDVTLSGLTIRNGRPADGVGGGGILAGAPAAAIPDSLTLSDCRISGNVNDSSAGRTNAPGGGVAMAGGSLAISGCTFSGNSAGSSAGGGVYFSAQHATDTLTVDGSVFRANTMANTSASGPGAAPNGGAALALRADVAGGPMTVTDTTFDANTATGTGSGADARGGAVYVQSGAPSFTRTVFTANSATGSGGAQALGGAMYVAGDASVTYSRITGNTPGLYHSGGALTATRNWWGCNAGPGGSGCDAAVDAAGTLTATPRLQLGVAVAPSSILDGATSTATAGFLTDSAAAAVPAGQLGAVAGTPVTWTATGGTLSAQQAAIQPGTGTATATYTGTVDGAGSVQATVDGEAQSGAVTVRTPPGAPTAVTAAVNGAGSVAVSWTPPTGGADSYRVYWSGTTVDCPASPCTVTGLSPGSPYAFTVAAIAGGIEGAQSAASAAVTALDVPAAAGTPSATVAGDRALTVTWSAPAPPVTGYGVEVSVDGGPYTPATCAASGCTLTGLIAGSAYRFRVTAANAAGDGPVSAASAPVVAVAAPDRPTAVAAVVTGPGVVAVSWTAPAGTVDSYRLSGGGSTVDCAGSPCAVTGLTPGSQYTFTVSAVRSGLEGAPSAPSAAVTALAAATAPTDLSAAPADQGAVVTWAPPASPAGITGYTATLQPGGAACTASGATATTCTVGGLTNGVQYTVSAVAHSPAGDSAPGGAATVTPGVAPGAPASVTATAGVASITVSWAAGAPGSGIAGYVVTATPGPATCETTGAADTSCVLGAEGGRTYTVTVVARGVHGGDSPASRPSAAVQPTTPTPPATVPATNLTLVTDQGPISTIQLGKRLTISGTGFAPYSTVTITVYSAPAVLTTVTADANGAFSVPVTVPADLPVGEHSFVALGTDPGGAVHALKLALTVAAAAPPAPAPTTLPVTGLALAQMVLAGLALVLAGAAARSVRQ